jgi:hypothetical protein
MLTHPEDMMEFLRRGIWEKLVNDIRVNDPWRGFSYSKDFACKTTNDLFSFRGVWFIKKNPSWWEVAVEFQTFWYIQAAHTHPVLLQKH